MGGCRIGGFKFNVDIVRNFQFPSSFMPFFFLLRKFQWQSLFYVLILGLVRAMHTQSLNLSQILVSVLILAKCTLAT